MSIVIGIILIVSIILLAIYCIKGYNLMVGMAIMATLFTVLALIGNIFTPNASMAGQSIQDVLTYVYQTGPANWSSSILVYIFFCAFFGRVLIETGIASTLIRKTVELGGDRPGLTMTLLSIITAVIFTSMTGAGPVISIGIIVLPILLSLGISVPVALFSFMGSIMAGMHGNILLFRSLSGFLLRDDESKYAVLVLSTDIFLRKGFALPAAAGGQAQGEGQQGRQQPEQGWTLHGNRLLLGFWRRPAPGNSLQYMPAAGEKEVEGAVSSAGWACGSASRNYLHKRGRGWALQLASARFLCYTEKSKSRERRREAGGRSLWGRRTSR